MQAPQAGISQAGDTTINQAIDRYNVAMELRRVRDTIEQIGDSRRPDLKLLQHYKERLVELRELLSIFEGGASKA